MIASVCICLCLCQIVFPVCDSLSGPSCPHLRFPVRLKETAFKDPHGSHSHPDAYSAHLHRPLRAPEPQGPLAGGPPGAPPPLLPLDTSRTFLHSEAPTVPRAEKHRMQRPYLNRGLYLEDGIGDVSAQSLSDAISNSIGHLGALTASMRDIWGPSNPSPAADNFVCFYSREPRDRRDCHSLQQLPALPSKYLAETETFHSGWRGASYMLFFDRSRAPFLSDFLERDYSFGFPDAETKWTGRWHVETAADPWLHGGGPPQTRGAPSLKGGPPSTNSVHQGPLRPLPLTGPLAESINGRPASYSWALNRRGPPQPISSFVTLRSHQGSVSLSIPFVAYGIWVSVVPRAPAATCSPEALEASKGVMLILQGLQEEQLVFRAEVPLAALLGLHATHSTVPIGFRYTNVLDFLKGSPAQRIDTLRFSYAVGAPQSRGAPSSRGAPQAPLQRPLSCSPFHVVLGALHILVAEKAFSSRMYYMVDAKTPEGKALQAQAHAAVRQQQQLRAKQTALREARLPALKQLLGGPLPPLWRPPRRGPQPMVSADVFEGNETQEQRESGSVLGVLLRAEGDGGGPHQVYVQPKLSLSALPVSWQENERIKFGRFDSMPNQFADQRETLNATTLYLQELPAEAAVVSLNQLPQLGVVFAKKVGLALLYVHPCKA